MSRHAVVDLALVFKTQPRQLGADRLPPAKLDEICDILRGSGYKLKERAVLEQSLAELRLMYEPYINALSRHFKVGLPPWVARENGVDNWQASFWKPPAKRHKAPEEVDERHF